MMVWLYLQVLADDLVARRAAESLGHMVSNPIDTNRALTLRFSMTTLSMISFYCESRRSVRRQGEALKA